MAGNIKVAIMGAGLSGLASAIILERHGIKPVIFEKRSRVGDRFINGEALFSILSRPVYDPVRYLAEQFQIYIKPVSHINRLEINAPNKSAEINEQIGFINLRGRHHDSFDSQLAEQVTSDIFFHSNFTYEELLTSYTHVIVATGDARDAIKQNNYKVDRTVTIKGTTVEGRFDNYSVPVWLDNDLLPNGYAYLLPFSEKEAGLAFALPEQEAVTFNTDRMWEEFHSRVCHYYEQPLKLTDQFHINGYQIGICRHSRIGNTFYTGNNFGSIMPFLGFGQFEAILTGIFAALDICGKGSYEKLTEPLRKSYSRSLTLRNAFESLTNDKYDFIVGRLNGQLGQKFFERNGSNPLKLISLLLRPFV
ncbi:NAD(P)/FAD-dependent oxidoreductase [Evansella clarkii]|uniref:NAD(P)/FAD-dependent oxidoreductase n=1 Tax=Evansella clarkii TaxID=79879 RepID=UPI001FD2E9FE|nr:NAD(P)-binding protein [Evansella clarkii]